MKKLSKKQEVTVETYQCVSWLLLDACWMFNFKILCFTLVVPTVFTGFILIIGVKAFSLKMANLGILGWSLMNIFWMSSELLETPWLLYIAYGFFSLGVALVGYTTYTRKDIRLKVSTRLGALRALFHVKDHSI